MDPNYRLSFLVLLAANDWDPILTWDLWEERRLYWGVSHSRAWFRLWRSGRAASPWRRVWRCAGISDPDNQNNMGSDQTENTDYALHPADGSREHNMTEQSREVALWWWCINVCVSVLFLSVSLCVCVCVQFRIYSLMSMNFRECVCVTVCV